MAPQQLTMPPAGPPLYSRVFHPAFNLDAEDASDAVDRFDNHRVTRTRVLWERACTCSLLSSLTSESKALGVGEKDANHFWIGTCCIEFGDCLKLTKAMQKTSETLQSVADLYDDTSVAFFREPGPLFTSVASFAGKTYSTCYSRAVERGWTSFFAIPSEFKAKQIPNHISSNILGSGRHAQVYTRYTEAT
jgi:hypothetical protein